MPKRKVCSCVTSVKLFMLYRDVGLGCRRTPRDMHFHQSGLYPGSDVAQRFSKQVDAEPHAYSNVAGQVRTIQGARAPSTTASCATKWFALSVPVYGEGHRYHNVPSVSCVNFLPAVSR